jgi:hypothetical protein
MTNEQNSRPYFKEYPWRLSKVSLVLAMSYHSTPYGLAPLKRPVGSLRPSHYPLDTACCTGMRKTVIDLELLTEKGRLLSKKNYRRWYGRWGWWR